MHSLQLKRTCICSIHELTRRFAASLFFAPTLLESAGSLKNSGSAGNPTGFGDENKISYKKYETGGLRVYSGFPEVPFPLIGCLIRSGQYHFGSTGADIGDLRSCSINISFSQ